MIITIINEQDALEISSEAIQKIVERVLLEEKQHCEEVAIHLVDLLTICQLHEDYFNDPSPTDCISFPMDEEEDTPYRILGDVFVCPATAIDYGIQHNTNPYEETTLYIVHGLLHLMGYDDIEEEDRQCMRQAEARQMAILKGEGLILSPFN